jgi:hypothetical protein
VRSRLYAGKPVNPPLLVLSDRRYSFGYAGQ